MKKNTIIASSTIIALGLLTFFVPILIAKFSSKPLEGNFDAGIVCACGHDIFLHLDGDRCYTYCPGHADKDDFGRIEREGDTVTVFDHEDKMFAQVEYSESRHYITYVDEPSKRIQLPQVVSPWRVWWPYYKSEDR